MTQATTTHDLEIDHQDIAERLQRLADYMKASDDVLARDEWHELDDALLRHLDAEESLLLPRFSSVDEKEAAALRSEHAELRRLLGEIGIAFELHTMRADRIDPLANLLTTHMARERRSLYPWANAQENHALLRAATRRLRTTRTRRSRDAAVAALIDLVEACDNGALGYHSAADHVRDEGYRLLFARYAAHRAEYGAELRAALGTMGTKLAEGTLLGAAHRMWLDARATIASGSPRAILRECQRGEHAAMRVYRTALHAPLPPTVREMVQDHYAALKAASAEIDGLVRRDGSGEAAR